MKHAYTLSLLLLPFLMSAQGNQPYFASLAFMPDAAADQGSNVYRVELTIIDQTAVYDGLDIADDSTFFLITQGLTVGDDINLYPITNIVSAFGWDRRCYASNHQTGFSLMYPVPETL